MGFEVLSATREVPQEFPGSTVKITELSKGTYSVNALAGDSTFPLTWFSALL
jgi:hypothetical protein